MKKQMERKGQKEASVKDSRDVDERDEGLNVRSLLQTCVSKHSKRSNVS